MLIQEFQLLLLTQTFQFACSWSLPGWLRSRDSTSICMDPTSQPEWLPNSDCSSSLTSPSSCVSSSAYKKNCLAYCEQYLYWFLSPEVPFSDATCEPYTACTFAGQKSLSITNSYAFSGGFTAKVPLSELEAAFNLGATYTYSKTSATSQTLTSTRPNGSFGDCGYWTFLPYYVTSCGFYITADNADKLRPQDEQCGGLYCETTPFTCSSDYDITFSCTNTTYLDSNGNAQGITVFVATVCYTNERMTEDQQDPRYALSDGQYGVEDYITVADQLSLTAINESLPVDIDPDNGHPIYYATPDPLVLPTCLRGCLCGYSAGPIYDDTTIYGYCNCGESLVYFFLYLASLGGTPIYTTPTNLSLLLHYDVKFYDFNTTLFRNYAVENGDAVWENISEGSNLTLQKGFECFGDFETISEIMPAE